MATSSRVCVLSDGEVKALRAGEQINCQLHEHVSSERAFEMTAPIYMQRDGLASQPVAEWVGPHHVRYILAYMWEAVRRSLTWNAKAKRGEWLNIKTKQLKARFA